MARHQGYYSLVQFCPDPARAEVANLGVLLFSPEHSFIDVQMSRGYQRVRTVFPQVEYDAAQLRSMLSWMKDRLDVERDRFQTKDDLCRFVGTRFNDVRLTAPRSIVVEQPEEQLKALFAELVALPNREERGSMATHQQPLPFPEVSAFFHSANMSRFVEFDQDVKLPVFGQMLHIPYVFTNGSVSFVKPERINQFEIAKRRIAEGLLLAQHRSSDDKKQEFIVLAEVDKPKLRDQVGQLSGEVARLGVHFFVEPKPMMAMLQEKVAAH